MAKLLQTKRVIQNKDSKLYFKADGDWTEKLDDAAHFRCFAEAISTCEEHELESVELVLKAKEGESDNRFRFDL